LTKYKEPSGTPGGPFQSEAPSLLKIVTVNWRNYCGRGAQYVNTLFDMVRRNLPEGMEGEFHCFTDDAEGLDPAIVRRDLPGDLNGWWNKVWLFREGTFSPEDRIVYFDLDTLITGRLDDIVAYDGPFAILRDFWRPEGLQSSVMAWSPDAVSFIWEEWEKAGRPILPGGDQAWIERCFGLPDTSTIFARYSPDILQDRFSGSFVSFKASAGVAPDKASVVVFHGLPRPHEVTAGWVPEVWKIGGITRAELDTICNTGTETLLANVRANLTRGLPFIAAQDPHEGHAVLVGGGPSLSDTVDEIRWRQSIGQQVWALNGSAAWLRERGIIPDVHVIVDARPENAVFVEGASEQTKHLVASQCDPAVFDALRDHSVIRWHSGADGLEGVLEGDASHAAVISGGSTVGLQAMALAFCWGFRFIHLYGFDSSLREDAHHAYRQTMNDGDFIVDAIVGPHKFRSTAWMVHQAQQFEKLAADLAERDCIITVHGDGLLPTVARMMGEAPASPLHVRAAEILSRLPPGKVRGAEIGVFQGSLSALLLDDPRVHLIMVDSWAADGADYVGESGDWHARLSAEQQNGFMQAALAQTAFAGERATVLRLPSVCAAAAIPDASLDFVFIDADHSYEGCARDIAAWLPKLKPDGLLCGHDYGNEDFPQFGVNRAVDEFVAARGLTLELGGNFTWFTRLNRAASEAA
jgi:hypothetical protein